MSENSKSCGQVPRQTIATEIMQQASALHQRAQLLSERTRSRLEAISRSESTAPANARDTLKPMQEFPPFFGELRSHFQGVESYLRDIEEALDRVEL